MDKQTDLLNKKYLEKIKYEKIGETQDCKERQLNWNIAFGLQAVDNLTPSKYMVDLATENIIGNKDYDIVEKEIKEYYQNEKKENINKDEKEADEVSLRIVKILNDKAFTFNYLTLKHYHKKLFENIDIGIDKKYLDKIKYEKIGETKDCEERRLNWNIAFGLQAVDNLVPSRSMVRLAEENIIGETS